MVESNRPDAPPTLDYHQPRPETSWWRRTTSDDRVWLFLLGLTVGSLLTSATLGSNLNPLVFAPVMIIFLGFTSLQIPLVFWMRRLAPGEAPGRETLRWFGPLFTILYYPAAHAAFYKLGAVSSSGSYVLWVSPWKFLLPWLIYGIALTAASWNAKAFGERGIDWIVAGFVVPVSLWATWNGIVYLSYSATRDRHISPDTIHFMWLAICVAPLLIGLTFSTRRLVKVE